MLVYAKILRRRVRGAGATAVSIRFTALIRLQWRFNKEDGEGDVGERGLAVGLKRELFRGVKTTKMLMLRAACLQW